jgi:ammonium transporter Rh
MVRGCVRIVRSVPRWPAAAHLQVPFYTLNSWLVYQKFQALDAGGSMVIHVFGAFFGLATSLWVAKGPGGGSSHPSNDGASLASNMTAMIGTLFLWVLWPR